MDRKWMFVTLARGTSVARDWLDACSVTRVAIAPTSQCDKFY